MALFVEVKFSLLHSLFVLLFEQLDFICVASMQGFDLVSDGVIPLDLEINFVLMILLELVDLLLVPSLFAF